jgi:ribosome maturation factor RimP
MDAIARIESIIGPSLEAMGYEVVRVRLTGNQRPVLQVMAERKSDGQMTIDDCEQVSRTVSALLDVEDPINGAYELEVSSPGIDRPLTRAKDYERFAGFEARVETKRPIDGRKRFRGQVLGLAGHDDNLAVALSVEGARVEIPLADVAGAKLVLTDELIAASLKQNRN